MEATLKNRNARAAAGKTVGDSGPADPGANDRHINCFGYVIHSSDRRDAHVAHCIQMHSTAAETERASHRAWLTGERPGDLMALQLAVATCVRA
jgi:hypothetical protein